MAALSDTHVIGVIGAGTMGAGIAQVAAAYGHPVKLYDQSAEAIERGLSGIQQGLDKLVARGKWQADAVSALVGRIQPVTALEDFADCALVVEAIIENLDIKQTLFAELEQICADEVILASNTSSISVTAIGAALQQPERLVGMHFFNPAPVMRLVEVVSGLATSPAVAERVADTASAWGKQTVHAKSTPGFIVNRIARPFYAESLRLLEEGAGDPASLDAVLRDGGGFRMGAFALTDLIGQDVNYAVTESVFQACFQDPRFLPSLLQKEMVAGGLLGRKSGQGFYACHEGATPAEARFSESAYRPDSVQWLGSLGVAEPLKKACEQAEITVKNSFGDGLIELPAAILALTDGRTATRRANQESIDNLVLFDLQLDYTDSPVIAVSAARQASADALPQAVGFFNALGKQVVVLGDAPGLCLMRTVCMLANEGADAVYQGVCNMTDVDRAMRYGLNYPRGPMAWADQIGVAAVVDVLGNLAGHYGLDRYRTSLLLQQAADAGQPLLSEAQ